LTESFKKSDVEILVATMHRDTLNFLAPMFSSAPFYNYSILIINQTTEQNILSSDYPSVRVINSFETGLSKSRNLALLNATGKLCVITDDDVEFKPDFDTHIINAFNQNRDAAVITFRTERALGVLYKKYPQQRKIATGKLERLNVMSIEMVLNTALVKSRFNDNFGLGARFNMGEEAVFINDVYAADGKIIMEPQIIVTHIHEDTHQKTDVLKKYYTQGAVLNAVFKNNYLWWIFLKLCYELKNRQVTIKQVPLAVKVAIKGKNDYNKILK
jgi:glycosyltransferase involved in cell wall biosynthesis